MDFEPVIGLEVHAQIHTHSKMFCACPVRPGAGDLAPNTNVCPVCTAMPGVLPVVNRRAVEMGVVTGLALHCRINSLSVFARKNYCYPDLPKGYQISQYELPLAEDGYLEIELPDGVQRVGITRAHLEEDTGKLRHMGDGSSLVDFNRAGVPLLEIVSEPDMHSVAAVEAYATKLRAILVYLGLNTGDMEKGMMRFEANVSLRRRGSSALNTRHEIKNLNSFRALRDSVAYEIEHQAECLRCGESIVQQTMGWDEARGVTVPQRGKEHAHDYRYFPEPDLPPVAIAPDRLEQLRAQIPELPEAKRERFISAYGLRAYDATLLTAEREIAAYYEATLAAADEAIDPQTVANWVTGELFRLINEAGHALHELPVAPQALAGLLELVERGAITLSTGKQVLGRMYETGRSASQIVQDQGLAQISDAQELEQIVRGLLDQHPEQVQQYLAGKTQVLGWLMGQVMRATRGKANPQLARRLLQAQLESLRDH